MILHSLYYKKLFRYLDALSTSSVATVAEFDKQSSSMHGLSVHQRNGQQSLVPLLVAHKAISFVSWPVHWHVGALNLAETCKESLERLFLHGESNVTNIDSTIAVLIRGNSPFLCFGSEAMHSASGMPVPSLLSVCPRPSRC